MFKYLMRFVCKYRGHKWTTYTVSTGYWSNDIEQAGYCERCGYDTHGEYRQDTIRRKDGIKKDVECFCARLKKGMPPEEAATMPKKWKKIAK